MAMFSRLPRADLRRMIAIDTGKQHATNGDAGIAIRRHAVHLHLLILHEIMMDIVSVKLERCGTT